MAEKEKKMYTCNRLDAVTGEPCRHTTERKFNLDRHILRKHKEYPNTRFIQYVPDNRGDLQKTPSRTPSPSCEATRTAAETYAHNSLQAFSSSSPLSPLSSSLDDDAVGPVTLSETISAASSSPPPPQIARGSDNLTTSPPSETLDLPPHSIAIPENTPPCIESPPTNPKTHSTWLSPWEQRRDAIRKRLFETLEKDAHPVYQVKRSKKWPLQQRAIDWLTQAARLHFDQHFATILAQWGVKESHTGTCILLPADWAALDPLRLASLFTAENCPREWADGVTYQYGDHHTSLTRARAWYLDWPRNGMELDNFLGCGPYKQRQGSHTCHHNLCGIHLVFESAEENEDRKQCHSRAKFLRQEGLPVPSQCTKHSPPCLMQHASLSTFETFLVQFSVLLTAKGQAPFAAPQRPRWHAYPTFEHQLPLSFPLIEPAVKLPEDEIDSQVVPESPTGKPELKCRFCLRIKAFKSIIALWSHLVHQHYRESSDNEWSRVIVDEQYLLEEVRRTAGLWLSYWKHSDGGKRRDPTMIKLRQVEEESFTWRTVLDWELR
ncbi:hypothetical protein N431DRAFT_557405 [Stipitochalara longipes BDJ]|nr:hypothetical protein N431DRAFT_557405 [Stipitochalara longipes BDJ]